MIGSCVDRRAGGIGPPLRRYAPGMRLIDRPGPGEHTAEMAVRVLGPIELDGDSSLSPRARTALCALVLRRPAARQPRRAGGRQLGSVPRRPPGRAAAGHYRAPAQGLAQGRGRHLSGGYRLDLPYGDVDVDAFDEGVARAREFAASRGAGPCRERRTAGSLALWRGDPFVELRDWDGAASEVARLAELRSTCEEDLLDARLAAGGHRAVASDARKLVERGPAPGASVGIRAGAVPLRTTGRRPATLRDARRHLVDRAGVDPGARADRPGAADPPPRPADRG